MIQKAQDGGYIYETPVCIPVQISSEGILCESSENESYEDVYNYGDGKENKGWY